MGPGGVSRGSVSLSGVTTTSVMAGEAVGVGAGVGAGDVLVVLLEFDPDSAGQGLFRNEGLPAGLAATDFSPTAMPRAMPGRTAAQWFFSLDGRAFCLYVVLGSMAARAQVVPRVNAVLPAIRIMAPTPPEWLEAM